MSVSIDRRSLMQGTLSAATLGLLGLPARAADKLIFGPERPFSFDLLTEEAKARAGRAYVPPPRPMPEVVQAIDYAAHGAIKFRPDSAVWVDGPGVFPVTFFHLGMFFQSSVSMNVVEGATFREIVYSPSYFDMPADSPARKLPPDAGFAGFRLQENRSRPDWRTQDWVAFLGASYFRAIGSLGQYGLSARGLALDTAAAGRPEEFPIFVGFWLEAIPGSETQAMVYALLDSPSVAGAYRFGLTRTEAVVMDIEARLFVREPVQRFGVTPLTSMYWYSETAKAKMVDWRPEVHDSDGLSIWTGSGERLWRPLNNPPRITVSSFQDRNPRGFGLEQRDRLFDHYQDGVYYERRPSLWVEPQGEWGAGAIQLIEIPTDDEIHDNIVAAWVPETAPARGDALTFRYRLTWAAEPPVAFPLGRCVATRLSRPGEPGKARPANGRKFVVDFGGGALELLPDGSAIEAVITASRGRVDNVRVEPIPDDVPGNARVRFDLEAVPAGTDPVEIRGFLRSGERALTETWLFQYHPVMAS